MTADPMGGVWSYALTLAGGLAPFGVEIDLAVMGGPVSAAQRADAAAHRNLRLHDGAWRLEWMDDPWADVEAAGDWLLSLARAVRPDIVHLNGYVHAALPWAAPVIVVAHSCVLSWWSAVHGGAAPADRGRYRAAVTAGVHAADCVVAPTAAMLDSVAQHYGQPADGRVILNGCDPAPLPFGARDAFGRHSPTRVVATHEPVVLAAGRVWDEAKSMTTLAAAAPAIHWPAFIAGPCEHPAGGRRELEGVELLGMLPPLALRHWYERAAILVHPAVYEPFGLVPLEAALSDTALVLSDIPSLREVWRDAAVYIPPRDAAALAATVNRVAADAGARHAYAAAALARARELSVNRMARSYHSLYTELTRQQARARTKATCAS